MYIMCIQCIRLHIISLLVAGNLVDSQKCVCAAALTELSFHIKFLLFQSKVNPEAHTLAFVVNIGRCQWLTLGHHFGEHIHVVNYFPYVYSEIFIFNCYYYFNFDPSFQDVQIHLITRCLYVLQDGGHPIAGILVLTMLTTCI